MNPILVVDPSSNTGLSIVESPQNADIYILFSQAYKVKYNHIHSLIGTEPTIMIGPYPSFSQQPWCYVPIYQTVSCQMYKVQGTVCMEIWLGVVRVCEQLTVILQRSLVRESLLVGWVQPSVASVVR